MTVGVEDDNESELIDDNESEQKGSWEMARTELVIKKQGRESSCEFCHAHARLPVIRIATINSNNPTSVTGFPLEALGNSSLLVSQKSGMVQLDLAPKWTLRRSNFQGKFHNSSQRPLHCSSTAGSELTFG